jgi:glycine dehydrogenase subunit 2
MKYNPRINEAVARLPGFAQIHPLQPPETIQGSLCLMYELQEFLKEIAGFAAVSLQPAAGAHGELTGLLIMRAFFSARGEINRTKILIPDSAHGTNPATTTMAGFSVVPLPTDKEGNVDLDSLNAQLDESVAGIMITNPNTLGLFDRNIIEVIKSVHSIGGLVYGDGANMNALLGITRPGDLGIDIMHFNLHKTFSTPHGGGGPGAGPVGVSAPLVDFIPGPLVRKNQTTVDDDPPSFELYCPAQSIGRVKAYWGHFGMMVRAYAYISMHGPEGLRAISENAVLNANYLMTRLRGIYKLAFDRVCMHEFVLEGRWSDAPDVIALDISKRLMDYGIHPPTNYFPLIVHDALMIEPTETESLQSLDNFIEAMTAIAGEAHSDPQVLKQAPHHTPVGRLDEVKAAKELVLCCWIPKT